MKTHPFREPTVLVWNSLTKWPKKGDRIAWRRDHLGERFRIGTVRAVHPGVVYALPDERNHGGEPEGGVSEIKCLEDMRQLRPGEGGGRLPDLRVDVSIVEHGYEASFMIDASLDNEFLSHAGTECLDFGTSRDVQELREDLIKRIQKALHEWREAH